MLFLHNFIEIIKVVLIGIIEGVTEWLPVSSTGHMLLFDAFIPLNVSDEFKEMFFVIIQFGAILAVILIFWNRIFPFRFSNKVKIEESILNMWLKVLVAFIPSAVLGFLFDDFLEENFGGPVSISVMLILYGILFILVENWNKKRDAKICSLDDMSYAVALAIGSFQVLAMIPGTSRSGATIIGALILGVSRTVAAEFTFFLAIPTMLGASVLKLIKFGFDLTENEISFLFIGMAIAFITSVVVIKFLMSYIKKHNFEIFGWYRIALGLIVLFLFCFR